MLQLLTLPFPVLAQTAHTTKNNRYTFPTLQPYNMLQDSHQTLECQDGGATLRITTSTWFNILPGYLELFYRVQYNTTPKTRNGTPQPSLFFFVVSLSLEYNTFILHKTHGKSRVKPASPHSLARSYFLATYYLFAGYTI